MRRGASTVIVVTGEGAGEVLAEAGRLPNLSVVTGDGTGLEPAAEALSVASRRVAPYVLVSADPLGELALEWHRLWDVGAESRVSAFEEQAGRVLSAWRAGRFELPDYYVVSAPEQQIPEAPHPNDLHLGVLASERPSRVISVPVQPGVERGVALGSLPAGPWWPPLDRLVDAARFFFPGRASSAAALAGLHGGSATA